MLVVNATLAPTTLREFIEYLKKNPGKVNYGSAGAGSLTHLTMELFKQQVASFMVHIPYRGVAPAFTDLIGGRDAGDVSRAGSGDAAHSFRARAPACSHRRQRGHPLVKDIPTMIESGFKGFDAVQWYGVVGPAGMPAPVVKQLNASLESVLKAPDLSERLAGEAVEPTPMTAEVFGEYIRSEVARWTKLARERNIQLIRDARSSDQRWLVTLKLPPTTMRRRSRRFLRALLRSIRHAGGPTRWIKRRTARCSTGSAARSAPRSMRQQTRLWLRCRRCSLPRRRLYWAVPSAWTLRAPRSSTASRRTHSTSTTRI